MELKLKDGNDTIKENNTTKKFSADTSFDSFDDLEEEGAQKPVVIDFNSVPAPVASRDNKTVGAIIKIIIIVVIAALALLIYERVIKPNFATTDVTDYAKSDEKAIAEGLNLHGDFQKDDAWRDRLPIYKNMSKNMTVKSNNGIAVIYRGNQQIGIAIDGKGYMLFGAKINDPEYTAFHALTFKYDLNYENLDDLRDTTSISTYYYNRMTNELLIITRNGNSNRVVAVTYFYDGSFFTNSLEFLDE